MCYDKLKFKEEEEHFMAHMYAIYREDDHFKRIAHVHMIGFTFAG